MKTFFLTDTGKVRDHNEDSVTILSNANNEYLLVVADGMGGHKCGEVASSMAVDHITKKFEESNCSGCCRVENHSPWRFGANRNEHYCL